MQLVRACREYFEEPCGVDGEADSCFAGGVHPLRLIFGIVLLVSALLDAFETVILPRRATGRFRLTRLFYILSWRPWRWVARRVRHPRKRETMLSFYGPLSLVFLIATWAGALLLGYALVYSGLANPFIDPRGMRHPFVTDLYASGTTLFTLGLGDVLPNSLPVRILAVVESGMGLGFVALVIAYFPVLYGAFSRREVNIALLDARAGSPPTAYELIKRHSFEGGGAALVTLLEEWERWSADVLESHLSYPVLAFYRSQHDRESWLAALTAILDACAVILIGFETDAPWQADLIWQAQLTFAMGRHAAIDMALITKLTPKPPVPDRLSRELFTALCKRLDEADLPLRRDEAAWVKLSALRAQYEPYLNTLADRLLLSLPEWMASEATPDNWQTSAWENDHFHA